MIITDGTHLTSDSSVEELHQFALKLGLQKNWFQDKALYPHYDLTTPRMHKKAIQLGAKHMPSKQLVRALKKAFQTSEAKTAEERLADFTKIGSVLQRSIGPKRS